MPEKSVSHCPLIPQYLEIRLGELKKEINSHRTTEDFWQEIRQQSNGQQVIVYGMLIAASLREKIAQTDNAEEKKRILQTVAEATTQKETVVDVLEQIGVNWEQSKQNLYNLFSPTD